MFSGGTKVLPVNKQTFEQSDQINVKIQYNDRQRMPKTSVITCPCFILIAGVFLVILCLAVVATILALLVVSKRTTSITSATTTLITTTSTASASTTTTVTTSVTTSSETTTTNFMNTCGTLRWNLTGERVAGTDVSGSTPDTLRQPRCLYIDSNDILYICDYNNHRVQKQSIGVTNGTTVAGNINGNSGNNADELNHPIGITFDQYGNMYVADYDNNRIQRYAPNSTNGTTVAGTGGGGVSTEKVDQPTAVVVDQNLNMYITENGNNRLVFWPANATNSTILINGRSGGAASGELSNPYDLILVNGTSNQVFLSDPPKDRVQLWTFGAGMANTTYSTVNALKLNIPRQIILDKYGNLYVADSARNRVVVFCANSTTGFVVVGRNTTSTPPLDDPSGIAFDSQMNLYVASSNNHEVLRYQRL